MEHKNFANVYKNDIKTVYIPLSLKYTYAHI